MEKNRILTIGQREIKKSFKRFLSLLIMSLLGVMVFTGIQATSPSMIKSLNQYYNKSNHYDLKINSSLGLTEEDINSIQKIDSINKVTGSNSFDTLAMNHNSEFVLKIISINESVNTIQLLEGKIPNNSKEIVIEKNEKLKIGDKITIPQNDYLDDTQFTIVGYVKTSLYINHNTAGRGNTNLGTGKVNYYAYVTSDSFKNDYFTEIYITMKDKAITSSHSYLELIENLEMQIESIKDQREEARYQELYNKAMNEILEKEDKANNELTSAKAKLDASLEELNKAKEEISNSKNKLNSTLKQYNITSKAISNKIKEVEKNIQTVEAILSTLPINSTEYQTYSLQLTTLTTTLTNLKSIQNMTIQINNAENEYAKGLLEYQNGLKKYEENNEKLKSEIENAKEELYKNLQKPIWHIFNRSDDSNYKEFIDDSNSITNLAKIFPIVFFGIAMLVSLISMSRMIEEDRNEIGTLKSLGFNDNQISLKYLGYSFIATLFGGIIGTILGFSIIPALVWNTYKILFSVPTFLIDLNLTYGIIGLIIAIVCICGTTIFTAQKVLKESPAKLMRQKSPKIGKRVFLEKIPFIWSHIKFSNKITIRNVFRYKKRVSVTIVGIIGCTALILTGFGLRDSIVDIANNQFNEIFKYDQMVFLENDYSNNYEKVFEQEKIINNNKVYQENSILKNNNSHYNVTLLVPNSLSELENIINLKDITTKRKILLEENSIIITDKVANLLNKKVGDEVVLITSHDKEYTFKIQAVIANYVQHYVFMTRSTYESLIEEYKPNVVYLNTVEMSNEEEEKLAATLINDENIMTTVLTSNTVKSVKNMFGSLDYVVFILIIFSAILSFVVFYNLSNINISERKREIATLKVLGFYDKEVDQYITKENVVLTLIGILLGIVAGFFLCNMIITTLEIEYIRFVHRISISSCIYASLITIFFTIIVNIVTHFSLKQIDMIESLKSVE